MRALSAQLERNSIWHVSLVTVRNVNGKSVVVEHIALSLKLHSNYCTVTRSYRTNGWRDIVLGYLADSTVRNNLLSSFFGCRLCCFLLSLCTFFLLFFLFLILAKTLLKFFLPLLCNGFFGLLIHDIANVVFEIEMKPLVSDLKSARLNFTELHRAKVDVAQR